jgi:hypothetical protein
MRSRGAAAFSDAAHVDGDCLKSGRSELARQVVKITGAAIGFRQEDEQVA